MKKNTPSRLVHPALQLADEIRDFDDLYPGDPDAEVIVPAETWARWFQLTRQIFEREQQLRDMIIQDQLRQAVPR